MVRGWLAQVQFRGTIRERSVEPYRRLLKFLREKRRVRGVLLDISSGGGESIASTDLFLAVKRLDQVKPVVASIGAVGASGAYMAAIGARRVFAYPDSTVGSIGVVHPHLAVAGLLGKLGVEVDLVHQGRHKDAYQGFRALTEEERGKLQAVVDDNYRSFVGLVAQERHKTYDQIVPLATGEFWSGRRAVELGLVDELGDREAALESLAQLTGVPARRVVGVGPPRPFVERLLSGSMGMLSERLAQRLQESFEDSLLGGWGGGRF
jgi:protease IV